MMTMLVMRRKREKGLGGPTALPTAAAAPLPTVDRKGRIETRDREEKRSSYEAREQQPSSPPPCFQNSCSGRTGVRGQKRGDDIEVFSLITKETMTLCAVLRVHPPLVALPRSLLPLHAAAHTWRQSATKQHQQQQGEGG